MAHKGGSSNLLSSNARKARYGVYFLSAICAQAGLDVPETNPDADHQAVDCAVSFPSNLLRVQVKCTTSSASKFTAGSSPHLSYSVKPHWRRRWEENTFPVFFVVVRLRSGSCPKWITHPGGDVTTHGSVGYWAMIDPKNVPKTVTVPESNVLTASAVLSWEAAALAEVGLWP